MYPGWTWIACFTHSVVGSSALERGGFTPGSPRPKVAVHGRSHVRSENQVPGKGRPGVSLHVHLSFVILNLPLIGNPTGLATTCTFDLSCSPCCTSLTQGCRHRNATSQQNHTLMPMLLPGFPRRHLTQGPDRPSQPLGLLLATRGRLDNNASIWLKPFCMLSLTSICNWAKVFLVSCPCFCTVASSDFMSSRCVCSSRARLSTRAPSSV